MICKKMMLAAVLCSGAIGGISRVHAQSVSPVIAEYRERASGSFQVTNGTGVPMSVVFEAKSFSIDEDGKGEFRELDLGTHLELSASSVRLEARDSATIFYKVTAEKAPAWLSIYSVFSPVKMGQGLNVRVMLPHTVYLYQKDDLERSAIKLEAVNYNPVQHRVEFTVTNTSDRAGRSSGISVEGEHSSATASGFPVLPHETRRVLVEWKEKHLPRTLEVDFAGFTAKAPVNAVVEAAVQQEKP